MDAQSPTQIPPPPAAPTPSDVPSADVRQKSPGLAWILSLLLPGSGQLFCGLRRGITTFVFSALALGVAVFVFRSDTVSPGAELLGGMAVRLFLALYVFAFLDAFLSAREINRGEDPEDVPNPRVAAVLNFTTKGFGYWYLGSRKLGLTFFFLLSVLGRAERAEGTSGTAFAWVTEIVLAMIAIDGYRRARKKLAEPPADSSVLGLGLEARPTLEPAAPRYDGNLVSDPPLALPLAFATGVGLLYYFMAFVGTVYPAFEPVDQSRAEVRLVEGRRIYRNDVYGLKASFPVEWTVDNSDPEVFFDAESEDGTCSASMVGDLRLPFASAKGEVLQGVADLEGTLSATLLADKPAQLSGLPAHEATISIALGENVIMQRWVMAQRTTSFISVLLTAGEADAAQCEAVFEQILKEVVIE